MVKQPNKVNISVESFQVEKKTSTKGKKEGVTLSGFALPFDTTSRNGFSYRKESVVNTAKTLEGAPMFFNHDVESLPIGRVEKVTVTEKGLEYVATLNPVTQEGKEVVEAVKAGLIEKVSIQCMYENAELVEKSNSFNVDVKEFLELSVVTIPGFAETTAQAHEKLMCAESVKKKLAKEQAVKMPEDEEVSEEQEDGETLTLEGLNAKLDAYISEHSNTHVDLDNTIASNTAKIDSLIETDEPVEEEQVEEETEEAKPEDEEEKSEESVKEEKKEEVEEEKVEESFERATVASTSEEKNTFDYVEWRKNRLANH